MTFRIAVAGAGVAGAIVAGAFRDSSDIEVICLEKVGPNDHDHAGNGLNVGPNALKALSQVSEALVSELQKNSLPWERWLASLADGSLLYHIPLAEVADRPGIRIRWSELYRLLRADAMGNTRFHAQSISILFQSNGQVSLKLATPAHPQGTDLQNLDLVVAADGRYSKLRSTLCGDPPVSHLGVSNFRALVADNGGLAIDDMEQWFNGPRRLICFRLADGLLYVSGNLPIVPGSEVPSQYKDPDFVRMAYVENQTHPDSRLVTLSEIFSAQANSFHWARAQEIETQFFDARGRVLFIGDAAHAMCPTLGQGATQAIEDAAALVVLLREAIEADCLHPALICQAFAYMRRERIEFVKRFSWEASEALLLGADPIVANHQKAGEAYKQKLRQLYQDVPVHPEWAQEALLSCRV
ncbi:MAG: NAD(P)/FAD-dependent oxidoreductase [Thermostichus sp. BF3_bins_97]